MNLFLIILISILSFLGVIGVSLKGAHDIIMQFPKNGFILNMDKLEEYKKEIKPINNLAKSKILMFLPIINVLCTSYLMNKTVKTVFNDIQTRYPEALISMTEDEMNSFNECKSLFEKINYYNELVSSVYNRPKIDIIDADGYEIINDEQTEDINLSNNSDLLTKYRNLRDEVVAIDLSCGTKCDFDDSISIGCSEQDDFHHSLKQ